MFGMRFALSIREMMRYNWISSKPNFVPAGEQLGEVDRLSSSGGRTSDEFSSDIQKARLAFINLRCVTSVTFGYR